MTKLKFDKGVTLEQVRDFVGKEFKSIEMIIDTKDDAVCLTDVYKLETNHGTFSLHRGDHIFKNEHDQIKVCDIRNKRIYWRNKI